MKNHDHANHPQREKRTFCIIGLGSLVWLLLRSGTDPRRLAYPCQQAALASSSGFLGYLASLLGITHLYRYLERKVTLVGASTLVLLLLLTSMLTGSTAPATAAHADLTLPGWTSSTATSNVFVVPSVPVPECSLDGGTLPSTPPCNDPSYALRDAGVDRLVNEMEGQGDYFFKTADHPTGILGASDVVVIKVNNVGNNGHGDGIGRLNTNTDVLKGLIWRILQHPEGFAGEVVVAENNQGTDRTWDTIPANSQDRNQSYQDVVDTFRSLGHRVSLSNWSALNYNHISGGDVGGEGYPTGEYANGNSDDVYILLDDPEGTGTDELSYPKFQTTDGTSVSMRHGVWDGSSYDVEKLTFINVPVLKKHHLAGATIAWKNLIGFITTFDHSTRYGGAESFYEMHDFFWGYTGGDNRDYGLLGRQMALVRTPDLNIVDAIWVADHNLYGDATREDVLLASTDPFAVDWYASEYVLFPLMSDQDCSAARGGIFRNATRTNQNAAASEWPGGSYPYIDLVDTDVATPSIYDDSDADFSITQTTAPSLTLISPNGGEVWRTGSPYPIEWTWTGTITQISLAYSADGFVTIQTITSTAANTGVYTWTTPPTPTTSAQVRITSVVSPSIRDTSGVFTLYDLSTFTNTIYLPLFPAEYSGISSRSQ